MKQTKSPIITLTGEKGQALDFYLEAQIEYDGFSYAILRPVDSSLGLDPDEAIVFRVEGDSIEIEFDDDIINAVSELYNQDIE